MVLLTALVEFLLSSSVTPFAVWGSVTKSAVSTPPEVARAPLPSSASTPPSSAAATPPSSVAAPSPSSVISVWSFAVATAMPASACSRPACT
ncbi:hypothetical protein PF010_g30953 [Phytophthora fragariae]|uniref:Uncharacterized protein n=1 Tax=Phytophthora fragariae TaxID=53985 RepID=A0A6G0JJN4_9STRA|nr:hypothetical protein PF010_g30953 [Phytophthora fragariae]